QVYRGVLEDLPESRSQLAMRLHVLQHPAEWPMVFGRRLDEARAALLRYEDRAYTAQYSEPGPDGRSPMEILGDRIVDEVRARHDPPQDLTGRLAS
ncbi:MAG: hypothetical protein V7768_11105, partial [Dietzia cercidiphylli]